jgi:hypothetical protein
MTFAHGKKMKEVTGGAALAAFFIEWFSEHQSWCRIHLF